MTTSDIEELRVQAEQAFDALTVALGHISLALDPGKRLHQQLLNARLEVMRARETFRHVLRSVPSPIPTPHRATIRV